MDARLTFTTGADAPEVFRQLMAVGRTLREGPLPAGLRELIALRVSQINGCAVCVDLHTKEAAAAGESAVRLHLVAAWREATVFTEAERAALELAEEGTRVADAATGVGDAVWARAAAHHDEEHLMALVLLISFMNMVNRLNVLTRQPAGDHVPARFR
ncbi:carboxymuconolactone decarboxylase family protein [Streptomyces catenulae]|uniref:Carboxymuconolactone decarboxylase family protein n=1 Tax=Streptomyces catenulae TaxID=66875 RepID=A0ABV2YS56_9ACTN|nr:carboxymuconolactone decarboxylase family protein [Streptomyces catenulae]